jgi:hypothetical protein
VLAPNYKKVPAATMKKVLEGTYVHIDQLIRQHQSSAPEPTTVTTFTGGLSLVSSSSTRASRTVTDPLGWFEAINSTVMPALTRSASDTTTLDECKMKVQVINNYINYCLAASRCFREYTFENAKNYLETHRQDAMRSINPCNIAEPNTLALTQLLAKSTPSSSSSSSSSSSRQRERSSTHSSSAARPVKDDKCGPFNSYSGCIADPGTCRFVHACRECMSKEHSKTKCPQWMAKNAKRK